MKTKFILSFSPSGDTASRCLPLVAGITLFFALTLVAQADVKWDQPPDPAVPTNVFYGWNELSIANQIIAADDYVCTNATPVVGIRWWGSYIGWNQSDLPIIKPDRFLINFWTDVPGGANLPWSHPGSAGYQIICSNFTFQCVGLDYDPRTGTFESCYQFEQTLTPQEYFNQPPGSNVIWISIAAIYDNFPVIQYPWGWKTRPRTNSPAPDAAVIFQPGNQNLAQPLTWPGSWPNDQWDLAFELITTGQGIGPSKWEQTPDLTTAGMDVNATGIPNLTTNLLADDFLCTQVGPITNIVIWGSWLNDLYPNISPTNVVFIMSIHTNIPANPLLGQPYSMPGGSPLWVRTFNPTQFRHSVLAANLQEGWYNPTTSFVTPGDTVCHQYEFPMTNGTIFTQLGTPGSPVVYWLDVLAQPLGSTSARFGWKTSITNWNDAAAYVRAREPYTGPWINLLYPATHPRQGQNLDLSFRINTGVATGGNVIKWSQPPCIATNPGNWFNGWDEFSVYGVGEFIADDWLCTNAQPVSDLHWWGSYIGWTQSIPPASAQLPVAFDVAIWTDVPANANIPPFQPTTFSHPGTVLWHQQIVNVSSTFVGWDISPLDPCAPADACFRFDYDLPPEQWFQQEPGTHIYWISISAVYSDPLAIQNEWGWKTRPRNPSSPAPDQAVMVLSPTSPTVGSQYQFGFALSNILAAQVGPWDMAFQLTGPGGGTAQLDFGDAPDGAATPIYPTLLANNGARHTIVPGFFLGTAIDGEADGQPNTTATGDDISAIDDEDGVTFTSLLIPGSNATVQVVASAPGFLNAWVDFGRDGSWAQPGDQIFLGTLLAAGVNNLIFSVPAGAVGDTNTYARFRLTSTAVFAVSYDGPAPDGEVEDYQVQIEPTPTLETVLDFGDAPDGFALPIYPTLLANNGARHTIVPGMFLGTTIDAEADGQPNITATGDDTAGVDDEDGVTFTSTLIPGSNATVQVVASAAGYLNAWVDFGRDGSWAQPGDQIFVGTLLAAGVNNLTFPVPAGAVGDTNTYARFRFSSVAALSYDGPAQDGEVEDYQVQTQPVTVESTMDFGDAPDSVGALLYPTLLIHNGARHLIVPGIFLGTDIDAEADGQPSFGATLDDTTGIPDDEDGVAFTTALYPGFNATVQVVASTNGFLNAWMDFNLNGSWADPGDQIFTDVPLVPGINTLNFAVPAGTPSILTYARFRFNTVGGLTYTGLASDGEVEDYGVQIQPIPIPLQDFDFGDAPDAAAAPMYPTLLANNGARHSAFLTFCLGTNIDTEADGQPNVPATGDDIAGVADDEDGVTFTTALKRGTVACVDVYLNSLMGPGRLDAWVDFNHSGSWSAGEQIFTSQPLVPGLNAGLCFAVPAGASVGNTYARFRLSSAGGLSPFGAASNGEVEDYMVTICQPLPGTNVVINSITASNLNANLVLTFKWNAQSNITYQLQRATTLSNPPPINWSNAGPEILGTTNVLVITNAAASQSYFRFWVPFVCP